MLEFALGSPGITTDQLAGLLASSRNSFSELEFRGASGVAGLFS
jgi:hypothetical protein